MTDAEKLAAIDSFLFQEDCRAEEQFRILMARRFLWYREADQLDMLDVIQQMDRYEYLRELETVITNVIHDTHKPRPRHWPLTGLRHDAKL